MKSLNLAEINSTAPLGSNLNGSKTESTNGTLILSDPVGSLTDLPHELLLKVIGELDSAALCALGSTCKDFNNLIFPWFFDKHNIHNPLQGYISCYSYRAPEHTLRAIRCSLSAKDISTIHHYFNKGIDRLVEEVEELHAIVRRTDKVTDFKVHLYGPDHWGLMEAPELDETQAPRLASEGWAKLYLGLLTAALTNGCECAVLSGGDWFLNYLQDSEQTTTVPGAPTGPVLFFKKRVLGNMTTRYFDRSFRYKSPKKLPLAVNTVPRTEVPEGSSDNSPTAPAVEERKRQTRLLEWVEFFSAKNKNSGHAETAISSTAANDSNNFKTSSPRLFPALVKNHASSKSKTFTPTRTRGPPKPKLQSLTLAADMFFASPSFLNWTNQLLSWCAPTLTHLELQFPAKPSGIWCKAFSELKLPFLICFMTTCSPYVSEANIQGSDILRFLSRNPSIQKLNIHRLQVSALPNSRKPILPNLMEVTAHPVYISWLLRDKKECPKLKEITLTTEYSHIVDPPFAYDTMDRTFRDLLPHSHKLDVIGFQFNSDHDELDAWLQSHINASPNVNILSSFVGTKCLRINARHFVKIINDENRLELVAQFAGLFPNLDGLELLDQPGAPYDTTDHIPPVIEALRLHSPQVKTVKINDQGPIDIAEFDRLEKE